VVPSGRLRRAAVAGPCDDCRVLETPEDITDAERVALVAYLEARS
jgi:hypothetical protein